MPRVKIDYVVSFSSESPDAPASNLLANEAGRGRWLCARGEPSCSVLLQLSKAVQISSITIGAHLAALVEVLVGRSETPNDQYKVLVASSVFLSPGESRKASEGDAGAERVRSFGPDQLASDVSAAKWDRVRVQCSQPYNKHCKYGLSFIHIFSPEGEGESSEPPRLPLGRPVPTKAALKMPAGLSPVDSDDDEFKPGALFAQHRARAQENAAANTDAQIRQATSQALKHQSDSSAKIVRTPISKPKDDSTPKKQARSDRNRDSLLYAGEDQPHDKIDRVVAAHKDQQSKTAEKTKEDEKRRKEREKERDKDRQSSKERHDAETSKHRNDKTKDDTTPKDKHKTKNTDDSRRRDSGDFKKDTRDSHKRDTHDAHKKDSNDSHKRDSNDSHKKDKDKRSDKEDRHGTPQASKRDRSSSSKQGKDDDKSNKKRRVSKDDSGECLYAGPVSDEPHTLLSDVQFVMSGYENPRRAKVRDAALAMGATFRRDWGPQCTHLICAFPNTPKLKSVRAAPDGHKAIVVTAEWIERCAARRRRLPWQWFATEHAHRVKRARSASGEDPPGTSRNTEVKEDSPKRAKEDRPNRTAALDSDCDTDDEIERVMQSNAKKRQLATSPDTKESPSPSKKQKKNADETMNSSRESDVAFVRDERIQGNVTVSDEDSDVTDKMEDTIKDPPDVSSIAGLPPIFEGCTFALHRAGSPALDGRVLRRYVTAYGGDIVEPQEDEELEVDYVLCLSEVTSADGITAKGQKVRGDWVWACHEKKRLCSPTEFAIV